MRTRPKDVRVNARPRRSGRSGSWRAPTSWAANQDDSHVYAFGRLGELEDVTPWTQGHRQVALVCDRGCLGVQWARTHEIDVTTTGHTDQLCAECRAPMIVLP